MFEILICCQLTFCAHPVAGVVQALASIPVLHSQLSLCWFFCSLRGQSAFRQARSPLSVVWGVAYNNEV